jgi:eukaryotic-like serine/threonine-protein kinase
MSDDRSGSPETLSPEQALELDRACDRFEAAWRGGGRPRVEDHLERLAGPLRSALRRELLALDLEWGRRVGGPPAADVDPGRPAVGCVEAHETPGASAGTDPAGRPAGQATQVDTADTFATRHYEPASLAPPGPGEEASHTLDAAGSRDPSETAGRRGVGPPVPGYEIRGLLGRGGMGVVYRALQTRANRPVALKMILGEGQGRPDHMERFRIEAESVARLRHPNVVQIYEVGEVQGLPYFSLELLEGGTLADRLGGLPMPPRPAAELLATLARAVQAAHVAGIVHRDLKPQNILFDRDGVPKVTDFGLAKRLDVEDGPTVTADIMGTPAYMAPEQALGKNHQVGPRADVYALGAILYAMLTGRPPLQGSTWRETLLMVPDQEPVSPSRLQPKVPRDLETICLKCLAKEPQRRYGSAEGLADDLARFLDGRPILARRTPAWERGLKWARRHPTAAAIGAIATAVAIGLAAAIRHSNETARLRGLNEEGRVAALRREAAGELARGQELLARGELDEARAALAGLLGVIRPEPRLEEVRSLASASLGEVGRRLEGRSRREADRARLARFVTLADEAQFQDAGAAGLDPVAAPDRCRDSARAALAVFEDGPSPQPETLTEEEREQVTSARYVLRLILAGAVARARPGEDPRRQAAEALAILDRAAATRVPTRAYRARRADYLEQAGDLGGARREREEAARLEPSGAFEHFLMGQERQAAGDLAAARRHLDAALLERPDLFWAQCLSAIGSLNARPSRPAEAKSALTSCLLQRPTYAWLHLLRGSAFGQMGAMAQDVAERLPSRAGELRPEAEADFAAAEADFRRALEMGLDAGLRYALHMNRGVLRFQRGRLDEAVADFERAVAIDPDRYNAPASLAQALDRQGRHAEAIAQLDRAIVLKPELAALYRNRALIRVGAGDRDRVLLRLDTGDPAPGVAGLALGDLEEAIRREPASSRAAAEDHARRARLLLLLGRPRDALAAADTALATAPGLIEAHRDRVAALLELRRFGEVIGSCDAALAQGPPSAELYELRGLARVGRGDFAGAVADYTYALGLRPGWLRVLVCRGLAYLMANAPELALADFEAVLRLDPSDADGYAGRGAARVQLRQHRAAVADAEESLRHGEATPGRLYSAARTYAQAVAVAAGEVPRRGRPALREALAYEVRARALLTRSLERTPADRREAFWSEVVEPDAAMEAIRRPARPGRTTSTTLR